MSTLLPSAPRSPCGAGMLITACAILGATTACADPASRPAQTAPVAIAPMPVPTVASHPQDWSAPVTVSQLVAAAQAIHPTRAAFAAAQAAASARVRQAGSWDNPELELSLGRARPRGAEQPVGGSLSQRLTWWGKRQARMDVARSQQLVAEAEGQAARVELRAEVRRAAIDHAAAVEALAQAEENAHLATALLSMTETLRAGGEADRASVVRARLEATTTGLQRDARRRAIDTTLAVLRTWCGPDLPDGLTIVDAFAGVATRATAAPPLVERHPRLRALTEIGNAAAAQAQAERAARLPDLTLGIFADREAEQDTYGLTIGVELPLWNRNQPGIDAAEATQAEARANMQALRLRLLRDLAEAQGAVETAQAEATALGELALPIAEEAIRLRTIAYQAGAGSLSDLLEARRAANAVQAGWRDARRRAALAQIDLDVALGDPQP
jgi:outer membrane protein, heavy metal efflux system